MMIGEWVRDGRAVASWGLGYAGFGAGCGLGGTALWGAGWVGWAVAGVGAVAVGAGWAAARGRPGRGLTRGVWLLCGLAAVASWSLLMDVVTLLFGQGVDSVPDAVHKVLAAAGALLLAGTARARGPVAARTAFRAAPSAAPATVQLAAWAGTLAFVPYVVMKLVWAFGGSFAGISGDRMYADYVRNGSSGIWLALERRGLDGTVLLAALGVFLLWGLVRPWGQVFPRWTLPLRGRPVPRWLPLAPALIGAVTLAPYGLLGIGYLSLCAAGVTGMRVGALGTPEQAMQIGWVGMGAFAGYGVALAVATRSYWRRTGPGRERGRGRGGQGSVC
ncbi:hypothetical protein [Kitasatospora sp. NPDC059160]|uniref:hypothetical protein n=1 Tax=Kitasatospora sp. NPDC059160 TaxID=3346748 RepID=UPI00369D6BE5